MVQNPHGTNALSTCFSICNCWDLYVHGALTFVESFLHTWMVAQKKQVTSNHKDPSLHLSLSLKSCEETQSCTSAVLQFHTQT